MAKKSEVCCFTTIILAAGISKRMLSKTPKILYPILGKPVIQFVVDTAIDLGSKEIVVVVGKNHQAIQRMLGKKVLYAVQEIPRGTGDATKRGLVKACKSHVLILYGDVPLLRKDTICNMIANHFRTQSDLSVLTCEVTDPTGYGRIIRDRNNGLKKIVEHTDANKKELGIKEINTGIYFGSRTLISNALRYIKSNNRQKEFYLTDIVHYLIKKKNKVAGFKIRDQEQIMGINTKAELAQIREIVKRNWFRELMSKGVYIEEPATTNIDLTVRFGRYVHIRPFTIIEGDTYLKDNAVVGPFVWIKDGRRITNKT